MKKLNEETAKLIKNFLTVASTLGIDAIIIDAKSARGENKENGIALISKISENVQTNFDAIGIGRVQDLKNKMNSVDDYELYVDYSDKYDNGNIVSDLYIKKNKLVISFKCQDPKFITAPKSINDPVHFTLEMSSKDVHKLSKSISIMTSDTTIFEINEETFLLKIFDYSGDSLTHEIEYDNLTKSEDAQSSFSKSYKSKILRSIFNNFIKLKDDETLNLSITRRGVMKITFFGIDVYLFPER